MNLFLLLLSSVLCKLHAQQESFSLGRNLCQSVSHSGLWSSFFTAFLGPVNLSPLNKSLLSMHTQPSRLSLLVQSQGHSSVMSLFIFHYYFPCWSCKESLCSRVNVFLFFNFKIILQRGCFVLFCFFDSSFFSWYSTRNHTAIIFSEKKEMILIQNIICI